MYAYYERRQRTQADGSCKYHALSSLTDAPNPPLDPCSQPTNHLDLASIEALKDALDGYGGGVILASHDQALICDMLDSSDDAADGDAGGLPRGELWEVKAHQVRRREGGIAEYLGELTALAERREAKRAAAAR